MNHIERVLDVSVMLEKNGGAIYMEKGGAAFEFAIIIGNPSERGGDEWGKFARVSGTRTFLPFFG